VGIVIPLSAEDHHVIVERCAVSSLILMRLSGEEIDSKERLFEVDLITVMQICT